MYNSQLAVITGGCKMEKSELVVVATPGPINPLKTTLGLSVIHSMPGAQCIFLRMWRKKWS